MYMSTRTKETVRRWRPIHTSCDHWASSAEAAIGYQKLGVFLLRFHCTAAKGEAQQTWEPGGARGEPVLEAEVAATEEPAQEPTQIWRR